MDSYTPGPTCGFHIPDKLSADWRAVEDLEIWNETYPQRPRSVHWYRDFYFTGIRLACDADQAPHPGEGLSSE